MFEWKDRAETCAIAVNFVVQRHHFSGDKWHPDYAEVTISKTPVFKREIVPPCPPGLQAGFSLLKHSLETSALRSYTRGEF
jgi:hypothetical protein